MEQLEISLKELIIEKYGSLNRFAEVIDMSWTTLDSILKRSIKKANISNIMKICDALNIDCESLYYGSIVFKAKRIGIIELNDEEKQIVNSFRNTDDVHREMVLLALNLPGHYDTQKGDEEKLG